MNHSKRRIGISVLITLAVASVRIDAQTDGFPNRPGQTDAGNADQNGPPPTNQNPSNSDTPMPPPPRPTTSPATAPSELPFDQQVLTWYGLRHKLEDKGLTFAGTWTLDLSKSAFGGLDTESTIFHDLIDLRFNVDTKALLGWDGGTFSADFQNEAGRNGSRFIGDLQSYDSIDADGRTQISEMWYEQLFFDRLLRIKAGKIDATNEFANPKYASSFLNQSFGNSPTMTGFPTYPDPATGINFFVYPTSWFYAGVGVYDGGGPDRQPTGDYGPSKLWHSGERFFTIGEIGAKWQLANGTLPGRVAVGGTYLSGRMPTFDGGEQNGAGSFYLVAEQKLWHAEPDDKFDARGLYTTFQYGHGDHDVSVFTDHFGGTLSWVGPYKKDNPDSLGVGLSAVHVTNEPGVGFTEHDETAFEGYYNWQARSYLSVRPDIQYIRHPGASREVQDALVFTVRLVLQF